MSTIKEIQKYVKQRHKFVPTSCWIADVKERCGIPVRRAWNRKGNKRAHPCPTKKKFHAIKDALKHFGLMDN
ncbi:hypothetical protein ES703_13263 [subsurface metagenome]